MLRSSFSGDELVESLLLILELLGLIQRCLFLFVDLDLAAGICPARLVTTFARAAIDLLCFLYSSSSLETSSEVSIVAGLFSLLACLDAGTVWATQAGCRLSIGIIFAFLA